MALVRASAIISLVFALLGDPTGPGRQRAAVDDAWETAIRAKGGRERLHQIDSVVLSATSTWGVPFRRYDVSYETLLVMPSQLWEWMDERPTKFGLRLAIADMARDRAQMVYEGSPPNSPANARTSRRIHEVTMLQAVTFMETRWLKPTLTAQREARIGVRKVLVVETEIGDQFVDFYLNAQTHLPEKIVFRGPSPNWFDDYELSDYRDVSGLQLPHDVAQRNPGFGGPFKRRITYRLNVDYDPGVFDRPPSLERGPQGWQRLVGTPR